MSFCMSSVIRYSCWFLLLQYLIIFGAADNHAKNLENSDFTVKNVRVSRLQNSKSGDSNQSSVTKVDALSFPEQWKTPFTLHAEENFVIDMDYPSARGDAKVHQFGLVFRSITNTGVSRSYLFKPRKDTTSPYSHHVSIPVKSDLLDMVHWKNETFRFEVEVLVGGFKCAPLRWSLGYVDVIAPLIVKSFEDPGHDRQLGFVNSHKVIHHTFKAPPPYPSYIASYLFSLICLILPWSFMIYSWKTCGIALSVPSLSSNLFFIALGSIFALFVASWWWLRLLETLTYLPIFVAAVALSGNIALRQNASSRTKAQ